MMIYHPNLISSSLHTTKPQYQKRVSVRFRNKEVKNWEWELKTAQKMGWVKEHSSSFLVFLCFETTRKHLLRRLSYVYITGHIYHAPHHNSWFFQFPDTLFYLVFTVIYLLHLTGWGWSTEARRTSGKQSITKSSSLLQILALFLL